MITDRSNGSAALTKTKWHLVKSDRGTECVEGAYKLLICCGKTKHIDSIYKQKKTVKIYDCKVRTRDSRETKREREKKLRLQKYKSEK